MESDYPASDALTDARQAREHLATALRPARRYYWLFACGVFLFLLSGAYFPPTLVAPWGIFLSVTCSWVASERRKRARGLGRLGRTELWAATIATGVLPCGILCAVLVRYGSLPAWLGWPIAVVGAAIAVVALIRMDRAMSDRIRAGL